MNFEKVNKVVLIFLIVVALVSMLALAICGFIDTMSPTPPDSVNALFIIVLPTLFLSFVAMTILLSILFIHSMYLFIKKSKNQRNFYSWLFFIGNFIIAFLLLISYPRLNTDNNPIRAFFLLFTSTLQISISFILLYNSITNGRTKWGTICIICISVLFPGLIFLPYFFNISGYFVLPILYFLVMNVFIVLLFETLIKRDFTTDYQRIKKVPVCVKNNAK